MTVTPQVEVVEALAERVAERVVEMLRDEPLPSSGTKLLGVRDVARLAGRSPDWVRAHRDALGVVVVVVGNGTRPRLQFDATKVREALSAEAISRSHGATLNVSRDGTPRRRRRPSTTADPLPIRGRGA